MDDPRPTSPPDGAPWTALSAGLDSGVPGRTRPRFEELPPGPPTWPAWTAIVLGIVGLMPGLLVLSEAMAGHAATNTAGSGIAALAGSLLIVGGLVWLALAGIVRRRMLGPDRYRGPSIIGLLMLVLIGGNLASLPILLFLLGGDADRLTDPLVVTVELLLTPLSFLVIYGLFVALPRALPGMVVWSGLASVRRLLLGIGLGAGAWIGMGILSELVNLVVTAVTGQPLGGEQAVAGLATEVPFAVAIVAIAVLAPFAEELFFRGAVLNAWEREYGTNRAIVGSSALFAVVHVVGGTALAVAQVFLLGLILAWAYVRTRSLATTIGLHGAFNLASVLALFLLPR